MKNEFKEVVTEGQLTDEIITVLRDEIVAQFTKEENAVKIKFLNGQNFILTVNKV